MRKNEQPEALATRPPLTPEQEYVYDAFIALAVSLYRAQGKALEVIDSPVDEVPSKFSRRPPGVDKDLWPALRLEMDNGQIFELRVVEYMLGYFVQVIEQTAPWWMHEEIKRQVEAAAAADPARPDGLDDDDGPQDPDDDDSDDDGPPVLPDAVVAELPRSRGRPYWKA